MTAAPSANEAVSVPVPPLSVSFPVPPFRILSFPSPVMLSASAKPRTFSMPQSVSVPWPVAVPVERFTVTATPVAKEAQSVPELPVRVSLPLPPSSVSLPSPPSSVLALLSPVMLSALAEPRTCSMPEGIRALTARRPS